MNSNLFGGLEGLGISGLEGMSLFGNEEKAEEKKEAVKTPNLKLDRLVLANHSRLHSNTSISLARRWKSSMLMERR